MKNTNEPTPVSDTPLQHIPPPHTDSTCTPRTMLQGNAHKALAGPEKGHLPARPHVRALLHAPGNENHGAPLPEDVVHGGLVSAAAPQPPP